jgi:transcriptional regulator with XRE-family HTH domain
MSAFDRRRVAHVFGAILCTARKGAGISQEKLAELADVDRTYPSLLERGLRTPTLGKFIDIADALGIEPAALVAMTVARLRREVL